MVNVFKRFTLIIFAVLLLARPVSAGPIDIIETQVVERVTAPWAYYCVDPVYDGVFYIIDKGAVKVEDGIPKSAIITGSGDRKYFYFNATSSGTIQWTITSPNLFFDFSVSDKVNLCYDGYNGFREKQGPTFDSITNPILCTTPSLLTMYSQRVTICKVNVITPGKYYASSNVFGGALGTYTIVAKFIPKI